MNSMNREQTIVFDNLVKAHHSKQIAVDLYYALNGSAPHRALLDGMDMTTKSKDVYFITDGEYVKVGMANDVRVRLNQMQTGNPKQLKIATVIEYGDAEMEHHLHTRYAKQHVRGEWYKLSKEMLEDIKYFILSHYYRTGENNSEITAIHEQTRLLA